MLKICLISFVFIGIVFADSSPESSRVVIQILDYISRDYPGAVKNGKVIDKGEYEEQKNLIDTALQSTQDPHVIQKLKIIKNKIDNVAPEAWVAANTASLSAEVLKTSGLSSYPKTWPSLKHGKVLYEQSCAQCHGSNGNGEGPAGKNLNPKPASFLDAERMTGLNPFQAFNSIRLGVNGTGMAAFPYPEEEIWELAFYVLSLRHQGTPHVLSQKDLEAVTLQEVATTSDEKLEKKLSEKFSDPKAFLTQIRTFDPTKVSLESFVLFSEKKLKSAIQSYQAGDVSKAKQEAVMAYLDGIEPIEPQLKNIDSALVAVIEQQMMDFRKNLDKKNNLPVIEDLFGKIQITFSEANKKLVEAQNAGQSSWLLFLTAAGIISREAFEAVLILILLLGISRSLGIPKAAFFIHLGWIGALALGVLGWFFSGWVLSISGLGRELLEGLVSAIAVFVLLYLGFWLHRKSEIDKWIAFIKAKAKSASQKKTLWVLTVASFFAVFREVFETILFLRALILEAGSGAEWIIGSSFIAVCAVVTLLTYLILKWSIKLPLSKLFSISTVLIFILALILAGKAVHSFQEIGWISQTSIKVPFQLDVLGLYSNLESLGVQVAILIMGIIINWKEKKYAKN